MQTALSNGDFLLDPRGLPRPLFGADAKLMEALLRLCARQGRFPLDPELGSELYRLSAHTGDPGAFALDAARRALAPMREVDVTGAQVAADRAADGAVVTYDLILGGVSRRLEVRV